MIEGLEILKDYPTGDGWMAAEHDIIWTGCEENPENMNPEDVKKLDELGFFWDDELDCWACYT